MIEIQQGAQPSDTLVQLVRQLADAKRGLHATEQALLDMTARAEGAEASGDRARAELEDLRPMKARAQAGQNVQTGNPALDIAARMMARVILLGDAS